MNSDKSASDCSSTASQNSNSSKIIRCLNYNSEIIETATSCDFSLDENVSEISNDEILTNPKLPTALQPYKPSDFNEIVKSIFTPLKQLYMCKNNPQDLLKFTVNSNLKLPYHIPPKNVLCYVVEPEIIAKKKCSCKSKDVDGKCKLYKEANPKENPNFAECRNNSKKFKCAASANRLSSQEKTFTCACEPIIAPESTQPQVQEINNVKEPETPATVERLKSCAFNPKKYQPSAEREKPKEPPAEQVKITCACLPQNAAAAEDAPVEVPPPAEVASIEEAQIEEAAAEEVAPIVDPEQLSEPQTAKSEGTVGIPDVPGDAQLPEIVLCDDHKPFKCACDPGNNEQPKDNTEAEEGKPEGQTTTIPEDDCSCDPVCPLRSRQIAAQKRPPPVESDHTKKPDCECEPSCKGTSDELCLCTEEDSPTCKKPKTPRPTTGPAPKVPTKPKCPCVNSLTSQPQYFSNELNPTKSALELAIDATQQKCMEKDCLIEIMTQELNKNPDPDGIETMLHNIAQGDRQVPDYNASMLEQMQLEEAPCPCETSGRQETGCTCNVDPAPLEITNLQHLTPTMYMVNWVQANNSAVIGYEIYINGSLVCVATKNDSNAIVSCTAPTSPLQVSIYALVPGSRCYPEAVGIAYSF